MQCINTNWETLVNNRDKISKALTEGNKILCKICQEDLFYGDLMKSRDKLGENLKKYMNSFKSSYDSFLIYAQTIDSFRCQLSKLEAKSSKRSQTLCELQMILLPKLQVLQMSFLHIDVILATPEMSAIDTM